MHGSISEETEFLFEARDRLERAKDRALRAFCANPIAAIAECFGSGNKMAERLGYPQATVADWITKGWVPSQRIPEIIARAEALFIPVVLTPCNFFGSGNCRHTDPGPPCKTPLTASRKMERALRDTKARFPFDDPASVAAAEKALNNIELPLWHAARDVWLATLLNRRERAAQAVLARQETGQAPVPPAPANPPSSDPRILPAEPSSPLPPEASPSPPGTPDEPGR